MLYYARGLSLLSFFDGCGINHPRIAGLASFIGVLVDLPTIGITKNALCGKAEIPEKVNWIKRDWMPSVCQSGKERLDHKMK